MDVEKVIYKVVRPGSTVYVGIMRREDTYKYSFVNLTSWHICKCQFDTIEEAVADMERLKGQGLVTTYTKMEFSELFKH